MNFSHPQLPVTCGEAKGILHKEKMKQGGFHDLLCFSTGKYPCEYYIIQGVGACVGSLPRPSLGSVIH